MGVFITRRGGGGGDDVIYGTFVPTSTTKVTVPDLKGKSRFIINCLISGSSAVGIMMIAYADGEIRQCYKSMNSGGSSATYMCIDTVSAGSTKSEAYYDPDTGTIDVSAINSSRAFNTSKTYEYVILG